LRDGGYCNQWRFGFDNSKKIIKNLTEANIDIIECGFITNRQQYDINITKFTNIEQIDNLIPDTNFNCKYVAMINHGEYDPSSLPNRSIHKLDGIRYAFHKKDVLNAIEQCYIIKEKGFDTYVQAMVSMNYSDEEFLQLIHKVNELEPEAFYIVDSFGMMKRKDLVRLFSMIEHNLKKNIKIGFHSHNNMQLSFSNAQTLVDMQSNRDLVIDSSIYGMGRGAGNLNTELFIEYLNENMGATYDLRPILSTMDEVIGNFYQINPWGYTLPNYLSAMHNTHPNYAGFLNDKNTLPIEKMNEIFEMMGDDKRSEFDKKYISELYNKYMETGKTQNIHSDEFKNIIRDKKIILIGPAKSSIDEKEKIIKFIKENDTISIAINHEYPPCETDFIFLSNNRRFKEMNKALKQKCIITSNIPADEVYLQIKYSDLLNDIEAVRDNAGLMAIKLLISFGASKIYLAGFDGYSHDVLENYAKEQMMYITKKATIDAINEGMGKTLSKLSKEIEIKFITEPKHYSVE